MFVFDLLKESDSFKMLNPFVHVGPMVFPEVLVENTWKIKVWKASFGVFCVNYLHR